MVNSFQSSSSAKPIATTAPITPRIIPKMFNTGGHYCLLNTHIEFSFVVVTVNECDSAIIIVIEPTLTVRRIRFFDSVYSFRDERTVGTLCICEFTRLKNLALNTGGVLYAFTWASWAFLTVLAGITSTILFNTLAFATNTFAFAGANFSTSWRNASIDAISARTIRTLPSGFANTLSAFASAMIRPGARQTVEIVTREVVALAKLAIYNLIRIWASVTFADTTNTTSSVVTKNVGRVV